jgi:hypothetical protein
MIFLVFFYNILGVEETSILLFLNKFDVIFFFTWLYLIGLLL